MTVQSKQSIQEQLTESAKNLKAIQSRKEVERATESLQETEPRQPPPLDLTRQR